MKTCFSISLLAVLMSIPSLQGAFASEPGLGRTWAKLDKDKQLTIGYFGGSITQGAGASHAETTCWRALTTAWFRQQFPQAQIKEINAAIGGTGSDLGAYRCQHDLLSQHPDLVFVEFAVNDFETSDERASAYYEGVIRQILQSNPAVDVVMVYTVTKAGDNYPQGGTPHTVIAEQKIADHYGLTSVNIGKALSQAIQAGRGTWATLTKDNTHPNDDGYRIYTDEMVNFLQSHLQDRAAAAPALPEPLNPHPADHATMVDAQKVAVPGWKRENQPGGRFPHIACDSPGATLDFPFHGTAVGIYWLVAPDGGKVDYSVDDTPVHSASGWDKYSTRSTRANVAFLAENLPSGSHVLHLKVSDQKADSSTGHWIRIGSFLVRGEDSSTPGKKPLQ
jgi:lysophospholipase L1-like esterase